MGIINDFFGAMLNIIFEGVASVSPVATLGISIIIFTLVTRLLLTPLQLSSQRTSRGMSKLQPEMQRIQNKYKNKKDQESQLLYSNEMKALYKKYKINPLAGCLPLLIQFPLIIALFNVLREPAKYIKALGNEYNTIATTIVDKVSNYPDLLEGFKKAVQTTSRVEYDITQKDQLASFLSHLNSGQWQEFLNKVGGEVQPMLQSALETKEKFETFLGVNLVDTPSLLIKNGMWLALLVPIIAGASTFIFSKITMASSTAMQKPAVGADGTVQANPTDSMMKAMNVMMPAMTAVFSYTMPIGLAVYWIAGNIIMMGQQWFVNKIVVKQEQKLEEVIRKERELEAQTKKVVKKKVIKKVPVQKKDDAENQSVNIQNQKDKK
jgi:YidC/Oxa1 family membrane protein insertase